MQKKVDASRGLCAKIRVLHFGFLKVEKDPNRLGLRARVRAQAFGQVPQDLEIAPKPAPRPQGGGRKPFSVEKLAEREPKWREKMEEWARAGYGRTKIICEFKIDHYALDNLLRDDLDFRKHFQYCLNLQKLSFEERALKNMENKNFNHNLWLVFMVNWFDYKTSNNKNEIQGDLNIEKTEKINVQKLTPEEIDLEIEKLTGLKNGELEL